MMRNGVGRVLAEQATAMYRAEAEAIIYELTTLQHPELTNQPFLDNPQDLYKWTKPLWKNYKSLHLASSSRGTLAGVGVTHPAPDSEDEEVLQVEDIPAVQSKEWSSFTKAFKQILEAHKESIVSAMGYGKVTERQKAIRPSKIPDTIHEIPEEERTYDPLHFTTLDPFPDVSDHTIKGMRRATAQALGIGLPSRASAAYASTAHLGTSSLRKVVFRSKPPIDPLAQALRIEDSFYQEPPPHQSTPKSQQQTWVERAKDLSPSQLEISVHSKTFQTPTSPPLLSGY